MPADRAAVLSQGTLDVRLELAETAAVYSELPGNASAQMKFETLRTGLFLRYGATSKLEVGFELPFLYRYTGFMSGMIEGVDGPRPGSRRRAARSAMSTMSTSIARNGQRGNQRNKGRARPRRQHGAGQISAGQGDLCHARSFASDGDQTSYRRPKRVFRQRQPGLWLGLAFEKALGSRWVMHGNLNGVVPTGRIAGFALYPTIMGMAGAEYLWSENFSLTMQFDYYTTPFRQCRPGGL